MIHLEILDSSPVYLFGLAQVLPRDGIEIVGLHRAPNEDISTSTDIYLMDIFTLQEIGPQASFYVSRATRQCATLILVPTRDYPVSDYLKMGATGWISKQEDANALAQAIRSTVHPELCVSPPRGSKVARANAALSARERQVLQYIATGYTHGQIATRLGISPHTVNTYVKRIRAKLSAGNKAELTRAAFLGEGLHCLG